MLHLFMNPDSNWLLLRLAVTMLLGWSRPVFASDSFQISTCLTVTGAEGLEESLGFGQNISTTQTDGLPGWITVTNYNHS